MCAEGIELRGDLVLKLEVEAYILVRCHFNLARGVVASDGDDDWRCGDGSERGVHEGARLFNYHSSAAVPAQDFGHCECVARLPLLAPMWSVKKTLSNNTLVY